MNRTTGPTALICDLGDVLFTWTAPVHTKVPQKDLATMLQSTIWEDYERGKYEEEEVYELLADQFVFPMDEIRKTITAARETLVSSPEMLGLLYRLKATGCKIFAMSNISAPDWEILKTKATDEEWSVFDRIFISCVKRNIESMNIY